MRRKKIGLRRLDREPMAIDWSTVGTFSDGATVERYAIDMAPVASIVLQRALQVLTFGTWGRFNIERVEMG